MNTESDGHALFADQLGFGFDDAAPIAPAAALAKVTDEARAMLKGDIAAVRDQADIVLVALHKGIVHTPVQLAPYERAVSHAAIDAGADVVINFRNKAPRAEKLAAQVRELGVRALVIGADLTDADSVGTMYAEIEREFEEAAEHLREA